MKRILEKKKKQVNNQKYKKMIIIKDNNMQGIQLKRVKGKGEIYVKLKEGS